MKRVSDDSRMSLHRSHHLCPEVDRLLAFICVRKIDRTAVGYARFIRYRHGLIQVKHCHLHEMSDRRHTHKSYVLFAKQCSLAREAAVLSSQERNGQELLTINMIKILTSPVNAFRGG